METKVRNKLGDGLKLKQKPILVLKPNAMLNQQFGGILMKCMCIIIYRLNIPGRPVDEVFAKVDGFSRYLASNYGLIYDTIENRIKQTHVSSISNSGKYYDIVSVIDDNGNRKNGRVNRLVLMAFRPLESYIGIDAHHIDENTQNNCLWNLAWKTHLENCQEHYFMKNNIDETQYLYTEATVRLICEGLCQSMPYDRICSELLHREYTEQLKAYIAAVRTKKIRSDISSDYQFPNKKRNTALFDDDQLSIMCKYIADGLSDNEILELIKDMWINKYDRKTVQAILYKLRSKTRFTRISDLYF